MFLLIISLVVVLPLIELYVIVQVGQSIGLLPTIVLLIAISAIGTSLVKREGIKVYQDFTATLQRGEEPSSQIVQGFCILAAGVFLLAPGFVSDVLAISLLLPPTRALVVAIMSRRHKDGITVIRATHTGPIVDVKGHLSSSNDVIDVEPIEGNANDD
jgi:UPF0716 protein FxsA